MILNRRGTIRYWRTHPGAAIRGAFYRTWHRVDNRRMDALARLAGACNADTWGGPELGYNSGYSHWRCGKARGHADSAERMDGAHRFNNYVWEGPGHPVEYSPVPVRGLDELALDMDEVTPFRKLAGKRHGTETMRRSRQRARHFLAEQAARAQSRA